MLFSKCKEMNSEIFQKKIILKDMSQPSSLNDLLNNYFFVCPESISQLNELASLV